MEGMEGMFFMKNLSFLHKRRKGRDGRDVFYKNLSFVPRYGRHGFIKIFLSYIREGKESMKGMFFIKIFLSCPRCGRHGFIKVFLSYLREEGKEGMKGVVFIKIFLIKNLPLCKKEIFIYKTSLPSLPCSLM